MKKTKEHNDYLMKPDDTQRHEDGSPNYTKKLFKWHKGIPQIVS
jgi:hypothetical protein